MLTLWLLALVLSYADYLKATMYILSPMSGSTGLQLKITCIRFYSDPLWSVWLSKVGMTLWAFCNLNLHLVLHQFSQLLDWTLYQGGAILRVPFSQTSNFIVGTVGWVVGCPFATNGNSIITSCLIELVLFAPTSYLHVGATQLDSWIQASFNVNLRGKLSPPEDNHL